MTGNYKVRIWAIIGEANTGKSPIIARLFHRSGPLKGGGFKSESILQRGGGMLRMYAKSMALQENGWTPSFAVDEIRKLSSRAVSIKPAISADYVNVLLALRYSPFKNKGKAACPAAHAYLTAFVNEGWCLASVVIMSDEDVDQLDRFGMPIAWMIDSKNPVETNGAVRNHFGWA